eukprot:TRINITY_DN26103_c0_g1_i1.p1 TRINITY_DN26103_c0_g1~~TRINITY_DN26103_c0_g1_i1.p1  ORF type:complete len:233 (-),score=37.07 TRINITY_DN26103_c0_g1_i1:200-871(-)
MGFLSTCLHLMGFTSFGYAIYYDLYVLKLPNDIHPVREQYGGQGKYLTFLNMCLQFMYFTVCLLADLAGSNSKIAKIRDKIFASAAFPIGIFVGVIFWGLYAVNRELIFPQKLDGHFPSWLNHFMHTTVLPLQLGEMFLSRHEYPGRLFGGGINALLTCAYLLWINYIYYKAGFWVYPVFRVLTTQQRGVFMAFCCALGGAFYILGEKLNKMIWKNNQKKKTK